MKKKTKLLLVSALLSGMFMTSCSEQDQHQLFIGYPAQGYSILHADEVLDSISFVTFDSWKVRPANDCGEWLRVKGKDEGTIKHNNNNRYWITTELEFAPNDTRHSRIGTMLVHSYEYTVGAKYLQYGHLNITRPVATTETSLPGSTIPDSVSFSLNCPADAVLDSISFKVNDYWQLEFEDGEPAWLELNEDEGTYGRHRVEIRLVQNPDTAARKSVLRLTSGHVSNIIEIIQAGAKKSDK